MDIYPLVAERLRRDRSVLDEAMRVLDHWDAERIGPDRRRQQWRGLLSDAKATTAGYQALIAVLEDSGEASRRLKDFAPFAGILSREQRRRAFLPCRYDH